MTDNTSALYRTSKEWRWPVVDTEEPPGVREAVGYVSIMRTTAMGGDGQAAEQHAVAFIDTRGALVSVFSPHQLWVYVSAARQAFIELGLMAHTTEEEAVDVLCAGKIVTPAPGGDSSQPPPQ